MKSAPVGAFLALSFSALSASQRWTAPPNRPPTACLAVNPARGTAETNFTVDAGCSRDDRTPPPRLKVRWDWENDGVWDTGFSAARTASHSFSTEGVKTIKLEVRDAQGLAGTTTRAVLVLPILTRILVGEPPEMPGATEPDVTVDPANPQRLVVAALTGRFAGESLVSYPAFSSADGGLSWTRSTGVSPSHSGDPGIEFDGSGNVFLSAIDASSRDGTPRGIVVAKSADGGRTFPVVSYAMDTATRFSFPDGSSRSLCGQEGDFFDYPKLAVDRSPVSPHFNNLYLIANAIAFDFDGDGTCETASHVFIRSRDGGFTWESGQSIPGMRQYTSSIGVAPDGTIYVSDPTFDSSFCTTGEGIALRKSVDGGASFLAASCVLVSEASFRPSLTWTAVDPGDSGKVYIAFAATVGALGFSDHVYVIGSADAGATWSAPVRIDDVLPVDAVDHLRPSLSISDNGRLDVVWVDYRHSSPRKLTRSRQAGDVYYSYSLDGGRSWAPNIRLSAVTAPLIFGAGNDSLTMASSGDRAHAVYAQDQNGNLLYETHLTTITFH